MNFGKTLFGQSVLISRGLTPTALTLINTWFLRISGVGKLYSNSKTSGDPNLFITTAFIYCYHSLHNTTNYIIKLGVKYNVNKKIDAE